MLKFDTGHNAIMEKLQGEILNATALGINPSRKHGAKWQILAHHDDEPGGKIRLKVYIETKRAFYDAGYRTIDWRAVSCPIYVRVIADATRRITHVERANGRGWVEVTTNGKK